MAETSPLILLPSLRPHLDRDPERLRPSARRPLAQHLDGRRTYIGKLEADGVIQRQDDGFPLDQSRVAYLRYLPARAAAIRARKPPPNTSPSRRRRCMKQKQPLQRDDHNAMIDRIAGIVLTKLGGWPALPATTLARDGARKLWFARCTPRCRKPRPAWRTKPVNPRWTTIRGVGPPGLLSRIVTAETK